MSAPPPATPDRVTGLWLTEALRGSSAVRAAAVESFRWQRIGEDQGDIGLIVRFRLGYDRREEDAPASVIGKFAPPDAGRPCFLGAPFERELRFYRELAQNVGVPAPRFFGGGFDRDTGGGLLLLEDWGHLRAADLMAGCSLQDAERVVESLARMHAGWWDDARLRRFGWLPPGDDYADLPFRRWWDAYPERAAAVMPGARLSPAFLEAGGRLCGRLREVFGALSRPPVTCVHRDVHAANLFFGSGAHDPPVLFMDWQLVGRGKGVGDLTYFAVSSLATADRRRWERGLVERYHALLARRGVAGYSLDRCWEDYQLSGFNRLVISVGATAVLAHDNPRKRAWRRVDLRRLSAFIGDHSLAELL
jgi:aminoglycoside/choline kinase family phosphotransferase